MNWRLKFIVMTICCGWMILFGRLVFLQTWQANELTQRANRQHTFTQSIPARPGDIIDRNGRLLATSVKTQSLYLVPKHIKNVKKIASQVAGALNLNSIDLQKKIEKNGQKYFIWVKRRLSEQETEVFQKLELSRSIYGFQQEFLRCYPQETLAAHLLGLRNIDGIGRGGIEQGFDHEIQGTPGERTLIRDSRGRIIDMDDLSIRHPKNGKTIVLSIDSVLQFHTEKELDSLMETWKPKGACVTVMDPSTGEILASASRPVFNPNHPEKAMPEDWKNLNVSAVFEPGSTFKPFIVAWALQKNRIAKEEILNCERGRYRMGPRTLHDHHRYGDLSIEDILVKSSNIGMAKIGERLTNEQLYRATVLFGFGSKTGSGLPGEVRGLVQPFKKWNIYSTGSIPMGQEIGVTPLQLISAHAALANRGILSQPRLVLKTMNSSLVHSAGFNLQDEKEKRGTVSPIIDPEICQWIIEKPMTEVIRRGTGKKAKLPDYTVFGKTGTAQKINPETGKYSHTKLVCSFVCGAPSNNPKIMVLVVVDEPTSGRSHYGGTVAAPTASRILNKVLNHTGVKEQKQDLKLAKKPAR